MKIDLLENGLNVFLADEQTQRKLYVLGLLHNCDYILHGIEEYIFNDKVCVLVDNNVTNWRDCPIELMRKGTTIYKCELKGSVLTIEQVKSRFQIKEYLPILTYRVK